MFRAQIDRKVRDLQRWPLSGRSAFIAPLLVVCATILGVGRFGNAAATIIEHVTVAQLVAVIAIGCALVFGFFSQREKAEDLRQRAGRQDKQILALTRVHEAASRLWLNRDLTQALDETLAGAIELLGAHKGNIQVLDTKRGVLKIVASRGFKQDFLDFFSEVSAYSCHWRAKPDSLAAMPTMWKQSYCRFLTATRLSTAFQKGLQKLRAANG